MFGTRRFPIWIGLCAVAFLNLMGCAPSVPPPEKPIEALYAPYVSHAAEHGDSTWDKAGVYSKKFKQAIDRGFEYSQLLDEPIIDYDPIVNAQDFSISSLRIEVDHPAESGKAHVLARFNNDGQETTVGYDMILEDGAWKIDGIRGGEQDLRKTIDDALKPIGDPPAMQAPVQAIYARYGQPAKVEPLHLWAPLTNDLRDKLTQAHAKSVVLAFDPVCGGAAGVPSNVKLEAVSSGVIARFSIDGRNRVAVYDVVEKQGSWMIDDIHTPGNPGLDLVQKLDDAGVH